MKKVSLAGLILLVFTIPHFAFANSSEVKIKIREIGFPKVEGINGNDVYGAVTYQLASYNNAAEYEGAIKRLLSRVSDKKGKYLFTIQLRNVSPNPVAIIPIAQAEIDERKKFLFFTESYKYISQNSWRGILIDGPMVSQLGNNLKVRVVAYYSNTSQVNFDTFTQLAALWNMASETVLTAAESDNSLKVWNAITGVIKNITNSMQEIEVTSETSMSFIKVIPTDPNVIFIETLVPVSRGAEKLKLTVRFQTKPSMFANYNVAERKFVPPVLADNFWRVTLAKKPIQDVLNTTDDAEIRKFYTALQSSNGYKDTDIGPRCQALKDFFAKYFNSRDEYAVYWAFLKRNEAQLKKNSNFKDCLYSDLRQSLDDMGLKTTGLLE